ncbi:hypothetical protein [Chroococcus sp. FPU101]|nr:hypothetical protein [Chroococcus sp. FPU101]
MTAKLQPLGRLAGEINPLKTSSHTSCLLYPELTLISLSAWFEKNNI